MVEKDRIEKLVMDNPNVYYDILPYAYVLGISDKWINKFEKYIVEPPVWLVGYPTGIFYIHHLDNMCRNLDVKLGQFIKENRAQKFSSSSGGGGFSGGGGGFSGGGGGGASFGGR